MAYEDLDADHWDQVIYIDLTNLKYSTDDITYSSITSSSSTIANGIKVVQDSDGLITINCGSYEGDIDFHISGTISGGSILIKKTGAYDVGLYLDGVSITSGNYPCIEVKGDVVNTYVYLDGENTFVDGREYGIGYSEEEGVDYYTESFTGTPETDAEETQEWALGSDKKGTLYSKGSILISGDGSLEITENYKHGIYSADYIRIFDGTIDITSTGRDGIRSLNGVIIEDGEITIDGQGKNTNNQSRGIVVEGEDADEDTLESSETPGEGFILINGGTITINTVSKGICAKWDIDDDAITTDTSDDPNPYVSITGGTVTVTTTGTPTGDNESNVTFNDANGVETTEENKLTPEGIEGKQAVYISGGVVYVSATDDAINASRDNSGEVVISGGQIYVTSSAEDVIDSNGSVTISGGVVYAFALANGSGAVDCDGTYAINGGVILNVYYASNLASTPSSNNCSQGVAIVSGSSLGSSGTTFAIKDSSSNVVYAFELPSNISNYTVLMSTPNLTKGGTYTMYKGVTATGGSEYQGLYYELPTVSGGTSAGSFTLSSYVYGGSSNNGGGMNGNMNGGFNNNNGNFGGKK